ncbi:MAG: FHA domain-containing protein [Planctomycetes bacterium]|nr:FHA domain-containing protein [Planctomycetota bacterium]
MAQYVLEILDGDRAGEVVPIADRALRFGRKPGNDIVLADEKTSGVHAEIVPEGDRFVLRDLGSTNGTFLDDRKVTELVLTPGDTFVIGRLRVRFRAEGETAPAAGLDPALQVKTLDASRLRAARGGRSVGLLAGLLVVALGVAGYLFWQQGKAGAGGEGGVVANQGPTAPQTVAGNKLAGETGACESDAGWNLQFAGSGFATDGRAHSGSGSLAASRATRQSGTAPDFAVAISKDPIQVMAGRALTIAAQVRTEGQAQVAVRVVAFPSAENSPFRFRSGTRLQAADGWTRVQAQVVVPPGCDRCTVELVALLSADGAVALVDDVALVDGGDGKPVQHTLEESSQTLLGNAAALAIRSTDPEQPVTLLAVEPAPTPAQQALADAGLLALSDLGASVTATPTTKSFQLQVTGVDGFVLVFPAESAGSLLTRQDAGFAASPSTGAFTAAQALLGEGGTRCLCTLPAPTACIGRVGGGRYRLQLTGASCELTTGFKAERQAARDLLEEAQRAAQAARPGEALAVIARLHATVPHDSEVLAGASGLRGELQAAAAERLRRLSQDLDEAMFFRTRGGFERVVAGIGELVVTYGEDGLEDKAMVTSLRQSASEQLAAIDGQRSDEIRAQLDKMAAAFEQSSQAGLAAMVRDYAARRLGAQQGGK